MLPVPRTKPQKVKRRKRRPVFAMPLFFPASVSRHVHRYGTGPIISNNRTVGSRRTQTQILSLRPKGGLLAMITPRRAPLNTVLRISEGEFFWLNWRGFPGFRSQLLRVAAPRTEKPPLESRFSATRSGQPAEHPQIAVTDSSLSARFKLPVSGITAKPRLDTESY